MRHILSKHLKNSLLQNMRHILSKHHKNSLLQTEYDTYCLSILKTLSGRQIGRHVHAHMNLANPTCHLPVWPCEGRGVVLATHCLVKEEVWY